MPKPPPPVWVPGRENRAFRGVSGKGGVIEKFILNTIPKVRDPNKPLETTFFRQEIGNVPENDERLSISWLVALLHY